MQCHRRSEAVVFYSLIILVVAESVRGNVEVTESSSFYSCCGKEPALEFSQECENTWDIDNKNIAHTKDSSKDCIPPCKKIEGGVMTLDACVAVNVSVVCTKEKYVTVENRIHYHGQPCSASRSNKVAPGNQGSAGLSLLAALIGGLIVKWLN